MSDILAAQVEIVMHGVGPFHVCSQGQYGLFRRTSDPG